MPNKKLLALALAALIGFYILPQVRAEMELRLAHLPGEEPPAQPEQPHGTGDYDLRTTVTLLDGDRLLTLSLYEYLCGVLCAELPADFPEECWKAQAVAARSYALYKMERSGPGSHLGAQMCTDYTCCTGYRAPEEALAVWGSGGQELVDRAEAAVRATDGIVAVYDGAVIGAVWHSASASHTASAEQVWGGEVAYLREVESPGGSDSPKYRQEYRIPLATVRDRLTAALPGILLAEDPEDWLQEPGYSVGGYLISVRAGGVLLRGSRLRSLLELPSAAVTWQVEGQDLVLTTEGTGHGVGMSQYGANAMAAEGKTYQEILQHYYTGITVESYE